MKMDVFGIGPEQIGYLFAAVPAVALYQLVLTRHVVPCKERKVVVTPWHVTSMGTPVAQPLRARTRALHGTETWWSGPAT